MMDNILFVAFVIGSFLDFIMAILGTAVIFEAESLLGYFASAVFAFVILCLRLCIAKIVAERKNRLYRFLVWASLFSIILDFFAVSNALVAHIFLKRFIFEKKDPINWPDALKDIPFPTKIVAVAVVTFLVFSPIIVSYLAPKIKKLKPLAEFFDDDEDGETVHGKKI